MTRPQEHTRAENEILVQLQEQQQQQLDVVSLQLTQLDAAQKHALREQENKDVSKICLKFFAGGLSATLVSMSLNSADHVKTRLQIQQKSTSVAATSGANHFVPYKSFGEAFGRVYREEGFAIVSSLSVSCCCCCC